MTRRPKKPDYNRARVLANTLANVGRAYLSRAIVPEADAEELRYAAERVEFHVNVVLRVIERHPDELAREAAIASLSMALTHAFIVGNWHYESPTSRKIVQPRLRAKAMRQAKDERFERVKAIIRGNGWAQRSAAAIYDRVRKAYGCRDGDVYPSKRTVKRAVRDARNETTPKKP